MTTVQTLSAPGSPLTTVIEQGDTPLATPSKKSDRAARRKAKKAAENTPAPASPCAADRVAALARKSAFLMTRMASPFTYGQPAPCPAEGPRLPDDRHPSLRTRLRGALCLGCLNRPERDKTLIPMAHPAVVATLQPLLRAHGRSAHICFMAAEYMPFINKARDAAVCYLEKDGVAVMFGDPVCAPHRYGEVLAEFQKFCRSRGWGMAVIAGSQELAAHAHQMHWGIARYGQEAVLNPQTNKVLAGTGGAGKSIHAKNHQLVAGGLQFAQYDPRERRDLQLEAALQSVYERWRETKGGGAYATVLDPFRMRDNMRYFYTQNGAGEINGFAALMLLGAENGYLIDPYVAAPDAPSGVTDLLIMGAMKFVKDEPSASPRTFFGFGMGAPNAQMQDVQHMTSWHAHALKTMHSAICEELHLGNKHDFYAKWKPDTDQLRPLYLMFPGGSPTVAQGKAILDATHVRLRVVLAGLYRHAVNRHRDARRDTAPR